MNLKRFERKTRNDVWKKTKIENYTHLNKNYCLKNQVVLIGDSITDFYNHYELFSPFTQQTGLKYITEVSAVTQATGFWKDFMIMP